MISIPVHGQPAARPKTLVKLPSSMVYKSRLLQFQSIKTMMMCDSLKRVLRQTDTEHWDG